MASDRNIEKKDRKTMPLAGLFAVCVFVLLVIVSITAMTYMLRPAGDTKDRFMGFYAEPGDSLDVILIGSSPTYSACVFPQLYGEYGICAYPLASNVQRPVAGQYLAREAERYQSPRLYMFEVRMYTGTEESLTINMGYTREVTDNMRYSVNRIRTINAMVYDGVNSTDDKRYTYYFDIFKYHDNWISLINPSQLASLTYRRANPLKGYRITDLVGPVDRPQYIADARAVQLEAYQEQVLSELMDYMDTIDADALFYLTPYNCPAEDAGKFARIKELVTARGYGWLDMNEYVDAIGLDFSRDFSDYGIHTNASGAEKCTRWLGEYLTAHYDLPDRRPVQSWDAAYEEWRTQYDAAMIRIDERIANEDYYVPEE